MQDKEDEQIIFDLSRRSERRRETFGKKHRWRRNEGDAYYGRVPKKEDHRDTQIIKVVDKVQRRGLEFDLDGKSDDQYDHGTNAILREFGMDYRQRDEAFAFYGKDIVKPASRIAAAYARNHGLVDIKTEIANLFEAIYWLGLEQVTELVLEQRRRPSDIITNEVVRAIDGIAPPQVYVRKPLEVIAANAQVDVGPRFVAGVPYTTPYQKPIRHK